MKTLTVSYAMARRFRGSAGVPLIRMRGHWLAALGFQVGASYQMHIESGKIILTPATDERPKN